MRTMMLIVLIVAGGWGTALAEPPPPPDEGQIPGMEERGPRRGPGGGFLQTLRDEDPAAYQRLMDLRKRDMRAFREALHAEMEARGIEPGRHWQRGVAGQVLQNLEEEQPEKFAALQRLHEEDPQAFREKMRELLAGRAREFYRRQGGLDLREQERELQQLAQRYREADNEAEKEELKAELTTKLEATFDAMLEAQEERIRQIEAELTAMRDKLTERRELRDRVIERRIEELTNGEPRQHKPKRRQ